MSLSNAENDEIRQFSAFSLAKISQNSDVRDPLVAAGGVETVLYLARTRSFDLQREVVPSLCCLSFGSPMVKAELTRFGGLPPIMLALREACAKSGSAYATAQARAQARAEGRRVSVGASPEDDALRELLGSGAGDDDESAAPPEPVYSSPAAALAAAMDAPAGPAVAQFNEAPQDEIQHVKIAMTTSQLQRLCCAALANLAEEAENHPLLVDEGSIPLLMVIKTLHKLLFIPFTLF